MEETVLVDALPYFDKGYDEPGVRDAAIQLIEDETKRFRPTRNYLEHLKPVDYHAFETEIMKAEFEKLQNHIPMEMLNMKRYELPKPPSGKMTDIAAWNDCLNNSKAQLEHQNLRIQNLELMERFAPAMWRKHNQVLERMVASYQRRLHNSRQLVNDINWARKMDQDQAGAQLKELDERWVGLVSKNFEIEKACAELDQALAVAAAQQAFSAP